MLGQINLNKTDIRAIDYINEQGFEKQRTLKVSLEPSLEVCNEDKMMCRGTLNCTIKSVDDKKDNDGQLELHICVDGDFSSDVELEDSDELAGYVLKSMFPYLQSYIRIISSLSDSPPITLPYPNENLFLGEDSEE